MVKKTGYSRLRQMALDYAHGRISRSNYLRERARFLNALPSQPRTEEPTPQPTTELVSRPSADEATIPVTFSPPEPQPDTEPALAAPHAPHARHGTILAAVIGILLVILLLLMALFSGDGERRPFTTDEGPDTPDPPVGRAVDEAPRRG